MRIGAHYATNMRHMHIYATHFGAYFHKLRVFSCIFGTQGSTYFKKISRWILASLLEYFWHAIDLSRWYISGVVIKVHDSLCGVVFDRTLRCLPVAMFAACPPDVYLLGNRFHSLFTFHSDLNCLTRNRSPSATNIVLLVPVVCSCACCFHIFENSLRLCQYGTDHN